MSQELDVSARRSQMALGVIVCGSERTNVAGCQSRDRAFRAFTLHFKKERVDEAKTESFVLGAGGIAAVPSVRPGIAALPFRSCTIRGSGSQQRQPGGFEFGQQRATRRSAGDRRRVLAENY